MIDDTQVYIANLGQQAKCPELRVKLQDWKT